MELYLDEEKNVEKYQNRADWADDSGGGDDDGDCIRSKNIPCVYSRGRHVFLQIDGFEMIGVVEFKNAACMLHGVQ